MTKILILQLISCQIFNSTSVTLASLSLSFCQTVTQSIILSNRFSVMLPLLIRNNYIILIYYPFIDVFKTTHRSISLSPSDKFSLISSFSLQELINENISTTSHYASIFISFLFIHCTTSHRVLIKWGYSLVTFIHHLRLRMLGCHYWHSGSQSIIRS